MVPAVVFLRDLHGTTVERLGVLEFALRSWRPRNAITGTPWSMASGRTLLIFDVIEDYAVGKPGNRSID